MTDAPLKLAKPPTCKGCPLYEEDLWGKHRGYVPATGSGDNGVLVVLEAAGKQEEQAGIPTVGPAGYFLWSKLKRAGIPREGFRIHNCLSCRPPENKLVGMPYEKAALAHCFPNLDHTILSHIAHATALSKTPVILTLGRPAFQQVMQLPDNDPLLKQKGRRRLDYYLYPHWNSVYRCWVIAAPHPSFLLQGNRHFTPVLTYAAEQAVRIASTQYYRPEVPTHLCDPAPATFERWATDYLQLAHGRKAAGLPPAYLAFDIETPYKEGSDEEEISSEEDYDLTITRCSFAYYGKDRVLAVSVPWIAPYTYTMAKLFADPDIEMVGWNSDTYDNPRIKQHMALKGIFHDGMLAWHVLHTTLRKGLGSVVPFFCPDHPMWKGWHGSQPALYSAIDSAVTIRVWMGILKGMKENDLWETYHRHVYRIQPILAHMSDAGVRLDPLARAHAEQKVSKMLAVSDAAIQAAIPDEVRATKIFKTLPKEPIEGLQRRPTTVVGKVCPKCGRRNVKADHFKKVGVLKLKKGALQNPCAGYKSVKQEIPGWEWHEPLPFKLSNTGLLRYTAHMSQRPVMNYKEKPPRPTFNVTAVQTLESRYPEDPLWKVIADFRKQQKLISTYIGVTQPSGLVKGGMAVESDGKVHTLFTHNPSTLRFASQNPNLQNLPRPNMKDPEDISNLVRGMIVAGPGNMLVAADFSGIEAVLVGYLANSSHYVRLALRDVHSFYTAYGIHQLDPARLSANDLPQLSWDDDKLFTHLAEIKKEFKWDRNFLFKHLIHAINFGQQPRGARETIYKATSVYHDERKLRDLKGLYEELFPAIPEWQTLTGHAADDNGMLRNAFGYVHAFHSVLEYKKHKVGSTEEVVWNTKHGPEWSKTLAFGPQSNAAGIMKEAMLRLFEDCYEEAGKWLRLTIHDELFCECPEGLTDQVEAAMIREMARPVQQLPLPPHWNMGEYLAIKVEAKRGKTWGEMD